jgi:hypothetical protein
MPRESRDFERNEKAVAAFCYVTEPESGVKCHSVIDRP